MSLSAPVGRKTLAIFVIFSAFLNLYFYNRQAGIEMNCRNSREFTKNPYGVQNCESFLKTNRTLQLRLSAFPVGGLGNKLFEIISLLGIASMLNRKPAINAMESKYVNTLVQKIQPIFPALMDQFELKIFPPNSTTVKDANRGACCKFDDPMKFSNISDQHVYLHGAYFQSFKYFHHLRPQIRNWLKPTSRTSSLASMVFPQVFRSSFVICPHVRRGDFKTDGLHQPTDPNFTRKAVDYLVEHYQKHHEDITVAVMGNDQKFAYMIFQDKLSNPSNPTSNAFNFTVPSESPEYKVWISPSVTPELDLAFSSQFCDVTLITAPSSTFGWWLSYLAKPGAKTYYRNIKETKDRVADQMHEDDFYPPDWVKLGTSESGLIRMVK